MKLTYTKVFRTEFDVGDIVCISKEPFYKQNGIVTCGPTERNTYFVYMFNDCKLIEFPKDSIDDKNAIHHLPINFMFDMEKHYIRNNRAIIEKMVQLQKMK